MKSTNMTPVVAASQRVRELGDVSVRLAARDAAEAARRLVWRGFRFLTGSRVQGGAGTLHLCTTGRE